jgi:hydrogenase nickel incorporation protein HypB
MGGLPIADVDLLFIENVGNLICPVGFDLGQNVKVGIFSATDGDDKPAKHPGLVLEADLLVLNKQDLLPHVPFDMKVFRRDLAAIRDDVPLVEVSALSGEGIDDWLAWLRAQLGARANVKA